ncbi:MAG: leucine-rich repeat protein, partial [Lachnospiraceae bacterium]|nr:leucine-rich repeat protein [Lachnospiraceae bacterium]
MKKSALFALLISSVLVLGIIIAMLSVNKIKAESISEDFQMDKTTLVKYLGSDEVCVIPKSTKKIATGAFEGNSSVSRVVLPDGLEEIEYNAFAEMSNLERVVLPDSVTKLGASTFANCEKLSSFYIGKNLNEIGSCIFAGCDNLSTVEVSDDNKYITCVDGVLYSADRSVLYEMLPGRSKNFYVFPDTVSAISPYAFWGCNNLEFVNVSDNVLVLPPYAFSGARSLVSVTLSFNTTEIKMKAFENCSALMQVYIPDSVKEISDSAFDGCPNVSILTTPLSYAESYADEKGIDTIDSPKYDIKKANLLR